MIKKNLKYVSNRFNTDSWSIERDTTHLNLFFKIFWYFEFFGVKPRPYSLMIGERLEGACAILSFLCYSVFIRDKIHNKITFLIAYHIVYTVYISKTSLKCNYGTTRQRAKHQPLCKVWSWANHLLYHYQNDSCLRK